MGRREDALVCYEEAVRLDSKVIGRVLGDECIQLQCRMLCGDVIFDNLRLLGKGSFGEVFELESDGEVWAVKRITVSNPTAVMRELSVWSRLDHPSVVSFHSLLPPLETSSGTEVAFLMEKYDCSVSRFSGSKHYIKFHTGCGDIGTGCGRSEISAFFEFDSSRPPFGEHPPQRLWRVVEGWNC
eukprot:TRINITY_DN3505_c0_g1_i3.p1 TRINITY_DN3505_c0_g1~~TRINITY_DN3505_c0_g1_i3.p1  ORF type:complete len:198 (+),score=43.75 TRINITY_DN3505_c0_g1_i3:44-595(+)